MIKMEAISSISKGTTISLPKLPIPPEKACPSFEWPKQKTLRHLNYFSEVSHAPKPKQSELEDSATEYDKLSHPAGYRLYISDPLAAFS